jgi:hypothetical protein
MVAQRDARAGVDQHEQEEDATDNAQAGALSNELQLPPAPRDFVCDIWPFAFSSKAYQKVINAFPSKNGVQHVVVISRSAHASPLLACHDLGKSGHMVAVAQSEHAVAHGQDILRANLYAKYLAEAKAKMDPSKKRVLTAALSEFLAWLAGAHAPAAGDLFDWFCAPAICSNLPSICAFLEDGMAHLSRRLMMYV